jgi:transposase
MKAVAMESTGVYWQPIYHILEEHFQIFLVNAQAVKRMPGRKTDMKDAEWLATLLQHGLLQPSFIPPKQQRELRDLTRYRTSLMLPIGSRKSWKTSISNSHRSLLTYMG